MGKKGAGRLVSKPLTTSVASPPHRRGGDFHPPPKIAFFAGRGRVNPFARFGMSSDPLPPLLETPLDPPSRRHPRALVWTRNVFLTGLALIIPILAAVFPLKSALPVIPSIADPAFVLLGVRGHILNHETPGA